MRSKYKIDVYKGKIFSNWEVIDYSHLNEKFEQYWVCKCKCGLLKSVRASHIVRGLSKGCSFCRGQATKGNVSKYWKGGKFIPQTIYTSLKHGAKNRNIDFNISIEEMEFQWKKQSGICIYTGTKLTLPIDAKDRSFNASLDRIDSSKSYTSDNIQWVIKEINIMKMNLEENKFLDLCTKVTLYKGGVCGV